MLVVLVEGPHELAVRFAHLVLEDHDVETVYLVDGPFDVLHGSSLPSSKAGSLVSKDSIWSFDGRRGTTVPHHAFSPRKSEEMPINALACAFLAGPIPT